MITFAGIIQPGMQRIVEFFRQNPALLLFAILLAYFSSFGQTFLISLYLPELERIFGFTNTALSSLYAAATMLSAFTLPWIGRLIDTMPLRRFTLLVLSGLILACLTLSLAIHPFLVGVGFFGLRLFGQGLMSHTSISTMARAFEANRGKAISFSALGHPLGEATLPLLITLLIAGLGWRTSLRLEALTILLIMIPLVLLLLKGQDKAILHPQPLSEIAKQTSKNPFRILKTRNFWKIAPSGFMLGFTNTAIFFYQLKFGQSRGWEPTWVAGSLAVFAIAAAISLTATGPLVDRYRAVRLFPFILIPYLCGVILLASFEWPLIYPISLALLAFSNGASKTIKNALFAEVYGAEIIGSVRSVFTTVMVFSTAMGPLVFGILLDAGWTFSQNFWLTAAFLLAIIIWNIADRPL